MALKGITVIEIAHLPPIAACTTYLCDFGATVIRLAEPGQNRPDIGFGGKLSVTLDIKNAAAREIVKKLAKTADVLVECLRPGTMERLGLGPEHLQKDNPRLIYARYSGYGQTGPLALKSGHDANFAALSGVPPMLAERRGGPSIVCPSYVLTITSGSLLCAYGILAAVIARQRTGKGQILDHSTTHAMAYGAGYLFTAWGNDMIWHKGRRMFNSDIYQTRDQLYLSVSVFEPQYMKIFLRALQLEEFAKTANNDEMAEKLEEVFLTKTRNEWMELLGAIDACVVPVLSIDEAADYDHNKARGMFCRRGDKVLVNPTPLLSDTPAHNSTMRRSDPKEQLQRVMQVIGVGEEETESLVKRGIVSPWNGIDGSVRYQKRWYLSKTGAFYQWTDTAEYTIREYRRRMLEIGENTCTFAP